MACVAFVVLSGKNDDPDFGRSIQQIRDECEPLVRTVRVRRQTQVNQGKAGYTPELPEQLLAMGAGMAGDDFERTIERQAQGV